MSGRAPQDLLPQFGPIDEQARVKAVITLGTPHRGTTVTQAVQVSTMAHDLTPFAFYFMSRNLTFPEYHSGQPQPERGRRFRDELLVRQSPGPSV